MDFFNKGDLQAFFFFLTFIKIFHLLFKAYEWVLFSKQVLRSQSRGAGGRKISENSFSLDDLELGPGKLRSMCMGFSRKYLLVTITFGLKANAFRGRMAQIKSNCVCNSRGAPCGITREVPLTILALRSSGT